MEYCNKTFNYPHQQNMYFHIAVVSLTSVALLGFGVNCFTFCFILANKTLRRKNICSAKLQAMNATECIFWCLGLLAVRQTDQQRVNVVVRTYYFRLSYFFIYGQLMAIGLVIMDRIRLASSRITLNTVSRNPTDRNYETRILASIFIALCINLTLTLTVTELQLIVMGGLATLDTILFVVLVVKLSTIKAIVRGNIVNARKRALSYVSFLMAGFILDMVILFFLRVLMKEELRNNCPVVLDPLTLIVAHCGVCRFFWDPVSYFLFNLLPRTLLRERWRKWRNRRIQSVG